MMRRASVTVAAIVFIAAVPISVLAGTNPDIGGTPIHTEDDYFSYTEGGSDWGLTVYSYVYGPASSLPDMGISLFPDEMLFVYLLDGDDARTDSVEYFSVYNPQDLSIVDVGYDGTLTITGYDAGDYQNPTNYQYSGFTKTVAYNFTGGYMYDIQPDEWSLVFYISVSPTWGLATGTVAAGGADEHDVPAPIPEPTTICLLGLGALALLRKRRA